MVRHAGKRRVLNGNGFPKRTTWSRFFWLVLSKNVHKCSEKVNTFYVFVVGSLSLTVWTLGRISEKVARDKSMCLHSQLGLSTGSSC